MVGYSAWEKSRSKACLLLAGFFVFGCGINPRKVTDIPSTRDYSTLGCNGLATEKTRIEKAYVDLRFASKHGTTHKMGVLNGQASAVNDQIRMQNCKIESVRIPGDPWPEADNDIIRH